MWLYSRFLRPLNDCTLCNDIDITDTSIIILMKRKDEICIRTYLSSICMYMYIDLVMWHGCGYLPDIYVHMHRLESECVCGKSQLHI